METLLYYWPLVGGGGNHRLLVHALQKGSIMQSFNTFVFLVWTSWWKNKQSSFRWFNRRHDARVNSLSSGGDKSLERRYNERDGISNHRRLDCLLNRLFRRRSTKTSNSQLLAFVRGIHRWEVDSLNKGAVTRKNFQLIASSYSMFPKSDWQFSSKSAARIRQSYIHVVRWQVTNW